MALTRWIRRGGTRRENALDTAANFMPATVNDKLQDFENWGDNNPEKEITVTTLGYVLLDGIFNDFQATNAAGDLFWDAGFESAGEMIEESFDPVFNPIDYLGDSIQSIIEQHDETPNDNLGYWGGKGIELVGEILSDPGEFPRGEPMKDSEIYNNPEKYLEPGNQTTPNETQNGGQTTPQGRTTSTPAEPSQTTAGQQDAGNTTETAQVSKPENEFNYKNDLSSSAVREIDEALKQIEKVDNVELEDIQGYEKIGGDGHLVVGNYEVDLDGEAANYFESKSLEEIRDALEESEFIENQDAGILGATLGGARDKIDYAKETTSSYVSALG